MISLTAVLSSSLELPEEYGVRIKNHGTELYISNVKIINRGSYRCRAVSLDSVIPSVDNPQVVFSVDVESKPHFADQPENSVVPENSSIVLRCSVDEEITKPPASITWLVNGEPVERYLDGLRKLSRNNVSDAVFPIISCSWFSRLIFEFS
ncbi:unnamed protein product [Trichobilharzia regenti]|nr:unnamed protein product [Trichobilharzia regenti]